MKSNSINWLLLALIFASYAIYTLCSARDGSAWGVVSGVVLIVASLVSLGKFVRDVRASKIDKECQ